MQSRKWSMLLAVVLLAAMLIPPGALAQEEEKITLEFWNWWGVQREPLMNEIIAAFNEDFPNVEVKNMVQGWDRREEMVLTAMVSGDPPEVMMASRAELVRFASEGLIVPITQYVEEAGIDLDAYYQSEIATMWWEGELYSLPMPTAGGETSLYVYNKTMFEEAGLDPEAPPETWQELWEASEVLNKRADDGSVELMAIDIQPGGVGFLAWLYTNNGKLYSDDLKTVTFNSPEGVETLQWMIDYVNEFYGGIENHADFLALSSGESGEFPFYQLRQAMWLQNVSVFGHVATYAPDMDYGVGLRPHNGENPDAESHGIAPVSFGWGYVIPTGLDPEVERAAFEWVKKITYEMDGPGACWFMQQQARPSPLKACNEDPVYYELNPAWDNVKRALESDVALPVVPPQSRILEIVSEYVDLAVFGELSPQEALDAAAEEAQAVLDEYWASAG